MTKSFIPSPHFNSRKLSIDMLVYHFTASGNLKNTVEWFKNPDSKASAHYVVDRDGAVVQMVQDKDRAWHAGQSEWMGVTDINSCSLGIEMVNWGQLQFREGKYWCWPNDWKTVYTGKTPVFDSKTNTHWEPYSDEQLVTCIELGKEICSQYQIPQNRVLGHQDLSPGRKTDPGPAFPWDKVRGGVFPIIVTSVAKITPAPIPIAEIVPPTAVPKQLPIAEKMAADSHKFTEKTGWAAVLELILGLFKKKA